MTCGIRSSRDQEKKDAEPRIHRATSLSSFERKKEKKLEQEAECCWEMGKKKLGVQHLMAPSFLGVVIEALFVWYLVLGLLHLNVCP